MTLWTAYRLRVERQRLLARAARKRSELRVVQDRTSAIEPQDILLFCTFRNEHVRLPYFLEYYRSLGVQHFLFVDNDSDDGGREYLAQQPDVSLWTTQKSYKASRFGMDWITSLQMRYGHDHWCVTVDPDEFLVYPFVDTRPLPALTDWLDASGMPALSAMMLDMYPKGRLDDRPYQSGQNPLEIAPWFDSGNYMISRNKLYKNLWIQGGVRARTFFQDDPENAPALNKIPLVKWNWRYVYTSSTHSLLPRGLNLAYEADGGEKASGVLLHTKFLDTFTAKAVEEVERHEHYANGHEYQAYAQKMSEHPQLWTRWSERYINWRQLEILGLMSKGGWV